MNSDQQDSHEFFILLVEAVSDELDKLERGSRQASEAASFGLQTIDDEVRVVRVRAYFISCPGAQPLSLDRPRLRRHQARLTRETAEPLGVSPPEAVDCF